MSVAGPGFINLSINESVFICMYTTKSLMLARTMVRVNLESIEKLLVELRLQTNSYEVYLHCGHARGAAWGDALCRILSEAGFDVTREYYVNDAGNQIDMLAESMYSRYCELFGVEYPLPENGYHAQDIVEVD